MVAHTCVESVYSSGDHSLPSRIDRGSPRERVTDSGAHDRYMKTAMIGQCTSSHGARLPHRSLLKQHDAKTQRSLSWS